MRAIKIFDPWKNKLCTCPFKYTLNPYTGCSHFCLYCYATAYIGRKKSVPKKSIIEMVRRDVEELDPRFPIDMSLSSDPYPPEEATFKITRRILEILLPRGFKVLITTKSDIYVRDLDLLEKFNVAVCETITTLDSSLAKRLEPGAPSPLRRLRALAKLGESGIPFAVRVDPIIPGLNDDEDEIKELIEAIVSVGAKHIVTSTYKARPDNFSRMIRAFPEMENKWRKLYYPKGKITRSYAYLPIDLRRKLLLRVIKFAKKFGLTYATCREGLTTSEFFRAPSCDGTHLIPLRIAFKNPKIVKQARLDECC